MQTEINGKPNVVTFRSKVIALLHNFYSHQKSDPDTDKIKLVDTSAGVTVTFTSDMQLTMKKDRFLTNKTNKQQLVKMVGDHLEMKKCEVHHAPGDADLLIVQKAVELATRVNTVLVGDNTDLLILLCYHANLDSHSIFFRPEPKRIPECGTSRPSRIS